MLKREREELWCPYPHLSFPSLLPSFTSVVFPYWKPCSLFISRACWSGRHWARDGEIEAERMREWWWEYRFPSVGLLCSRASGVWDGTGNGKGVRREALLEAEGRRVRCEGEGVQRGSWIPPGLSTEEHVWLSSTTLTRTDSLACEGLPCLYPQPSPNLNALPVCMWVYFVGKETERSASVCSYHGNLCRVGWSLSQSPWMIPGLWHCHIAWLCCPLELCPVDRESKEVCERERERENHEQVIKSLLTSNHCYN